ncbi:MULTISPECIES: hypothetical protein [Rhizobium]|uniref:DUF680 domain-containing protein n=1 Tax=Rhizobium wenxiniae TaxID=1737357 RepID=A0A7W9Y7B7_9HYPH|nr:hypothetical protein [Rhizobium wenxiniae]MBB6163192.1 hypothetical protein [Rhizobium wenxiniae]GGF92760.1 hypothetical protein GCM10010924_20940 [Rhizobium wenxiniae]
MKTFLVVAAVIGLTSSAALADCAGHKVTASNAVDKEITTASIASTPAQQEMKQAGQPSDPAAESPKATP